MLVNKMQHFSIGRDLDPRQLLEEVEGGAAVTQIAESHFPDDERMDRNRSLIEEAIESWVG